MKFREIEFEIFYFNKKSLIYFFIILNLLQVWLILVNHLNYAYEDLT